MNKGKINIKTHQFFSFNKIFAILQKGENVFWPGCAILSMGENITISTYELLKEQIPDLKMGTLCCGNPSLHIDGGLPYEKKKKYINEELRKAGVKRIYTLCPNCQNTLYDNCHCEIISAWVILDKAIPKELYDFYKGRKLSLHDPCPVRAHLENPRAVRNILIKLGIDILEFENNKERTLCCGKKNMIMELDPEKGKKIFQVRANQAPSKSIVTYCASCADTFKSSGFEGIHILELLWQTETNKSWSNRFKTVVKIGRNE